MIRKNILSIIVALIILYLSFSDTEKFNKIQFIQFQGIDKIVHFVMYFGFMSAILFENRKIIVKKSQFFLVAIIPFVFGALIELLQSWITTSRSGSIFDLLFNLIGILVSVLIFLIISPFKEKQLRK